MSYGFLDQAGFLLKFRGWMRRLARAGERPSLTIDRAPGKREVVVNVPGARDFDALPVLLFLLAVLVTLASILWWRSRRSLPVATRAFRAMRSAAARRDPAIGAATGPLAMARWLERNAPAAATAGGGLIDLYLRESWSGERLSHRQASTVRRELRQVRRLLRRRQSEAGLPAEPGRGARRDRPAGRDPAPGERF
jgi:hypothetical protein